MKKSTCAKCKHFYQHFMYSQMLGFSKIDCGHCCKNLMRKKECGFFEERHENFEKEIAIMQYLHNYDRQLNGLSLKLGTLVNAIKQLKTEVEYLFNK